MPLPCLRGSAHKHSARPITAQIGKGSEELPDDVRQVGELAGKQDQSITVAARRLQDLLSGDSVN